MNSDEVIDSYIKKNSKDFCDRDWEEEERW